MSNKTNIEKIFRDKLLNTEVTPPTDVKSSIDNALNFPNNGSNRKGLYIIGVFLLLISLSIGYLFMNTEVKDLVNNNRKLEQENEINIATNQETVSSNNTELNAQNSNSRSSNEFRHKPTKITLGENFDDKNVNGLDKETDKDNKIVTEEELALEKKKNVSNTDVMSVRKNKIENNNTNKNKLSSIDKSESNLLSEVDSKTKQIKETLNKVNSKDENNSGSELESEKETSLSSNGEDVKPEVTKEEEKQKEEDSDNQSKENKKDDEESDKENTTTPADNKTKKAFNPSFAAGINTNLGQFNPNSINLSSANSSTKLEINNMEFSVEAYGMMKAFDVYNLQAGLKQSFNNINYEADSTFFVYESFVDTTYLLDTNGAIIDTIYNNYIDSNEQTINEMYKSKLSSFSIPINVGRVFVLNPNGNERLKLTTNLGVIFNFNSMSTEQNIPDLEFNKFTMTYSMRNTLSYSINKLDIILPLQLYFTPKEKLRYQDTRIDPKSSVSLGLGIQYNF